MHDAVGEKVVADLYAVSGQTRNGSRIWFGEILTDGDDVLGGKQTDVHIDRGAVRFCCVKHDARRAIGGFTVFRVIIGQRDQLAPGAVRERVAQLPVCVLAGAGQRLRLVAERLLHLASGIIVCGVGQIELLFCVILRGQPAHRPQPEQAAQHEKYGKLRDQPCRDTAPQPEFLQLFHHDPPNR